MIADAPLLELDSVHAGYGDVVVLHGISLQIGRGQVVGLTGRNGAGKTTTLRTISGLIHPRQGRLIFGGQDITARRTDLISRMGIASVPEYRGVFTQLTVLENLQLARPQKSGWTVSDVFDLFPILQRLRHRKGRVLSGGEQQIVAIARALLTGPKLLLLDEPSQGLAPVIVKDIFESLKTLKSQGVGMLLVEQRLDLTIELSDTIYVINRGEIAYTGSREEVKREPELAAQYLGVGSPDVHHLDASTKESGL